jgi:large subunit ribosomal protein L17
MRHHNQNRKFGRKTNVRRAFLRSIARALVMEGRIMTTEARAKEIRPLVEKMITRAKSGNALTNVRLITASMGGQLDVAQKLIRDIAPKYTTRNGGYIRIMKVPARASDAAPMALIELV